VSEAVERTGAHEVQKEGGMSDSAKRGGTQSEAPRSPSIAAEEALPLPVFRAFLRRLHNGPPQHAAAVKVALAVWQGAVQRGDVAGAGEAVEMVREEMNRLVTSILDLQEEGRRLADGDYASTDSADSAVK
jgi:hypothetical protein